MKITRFCWGVELSRAVKYLGIYGQVMSVIGAIGAVILFALPSILGMYIYQEIWKLMEIDPLSGLYGVAVFSLFINIGWFIFSHTLIKRNRNNDMEDVKTMIKIGSYVIGSLQAILFTILVIVGLKVVQIGFVIVGGIIITIGGIFLIFVSLLLHGIRTKSPGKIKVWIIVQFVFVGLVLFSSIPALGVRGGLLQMILLCLSFMYYKVMVIVHYNIILEDDTSNNMETAMNKETSMNTTLKTNRRELSNPMNENPPPYYAAEFQNVQNITHARRWAKNVYPQTCVNVSRQNSVITG